MNSIMVSKNAVDYLIEGVIENNEIKRVSKYNYNRKINKDNIENEEMKGRLRWELKM